MRIKIYFIILLFYNLFIISGFYGQITEAWVKKYDGLGLNNDHLDYALAMALDGSGNVYVTGGSGYSKADFVTIKYNSNGDSLWVQRYGLAPYDETPFSIAVDNSGNVFVTGYAEQASGSYLYTTLKYSPTGTLLWSAVYPTSAGSDERAFPASLKIDNSGNIFVTGKTGNQTYGNITTIKYNTNGVQQWVRNYDGPTHGSDFAKAMALDGSGNIYVEGYSLDSAWTVGGNNYDYVTIKYNTNGDSLWVKKYNAGYNSISQSLHVDGSGNVYVTGMPATLKYNTNGDLLWTRISYLNNTPLNFADYRQKILTDDLGNVIIIGQPPTPLTQPNVMTVKYGPNGDSLWGRTIGDTSLDYNSELALDNSGNIYVTAAIQANGKTNWTTVKYNPAGDSLWVKRLNNDSSNLDFPTAIKIDQAGNIYETGYGGPYTLQNSNWDFITLKYSACSLTVNAGSDTTIWNLSTDHANLTVTAAGGSSPVHYLWSTGDTTQSITVSPADTTAYFVNVTDANNCQSSDTVKVNVFKVACGTDKILVCHKGRTMCIKLSQLQVHLNHGDQVGPCGTGANIFALFENYPNPFNPLTKIKFSIPVTSIVKVVIYDITGREVTKIVDGKLDAGIYNYDWDGSNFASGVYFYSFTAGDYHETRKMVLIK